MGFANRFGERRGGLIVGPHDCRLWGHCTRDGRFRWVQMDIWFALQCPECVGTSSDLGIIEPTCAQYQLAGLSQRLTSAQDDRVAASGLTRSM